MEIEYLDSKTEKSILLLSEDINTVFLKGEETRDTYLEIKFPFKVTKLKPEMRDTTRISEHVLVFQNRFVSQYDIFELRSREDKSKTIGYVFNPHLIFEEDSSFLYKDDVFLQTFLFRAIICLLGNHSTLKISRIKYSRDTDFRLEDFFPKDILVAVLPFDFNQNFDDAYTNNLLLNLYLYGFYCVKRDEDLKFTCPDMAQQKLRLDTLSQSKYRKILPIDKSTDKVIANRYCGFYLKETIRDNSNPISKFHQVYGLIEIFKDEVLKQEIKEKISNKKILDEKITGYKIHKDVLEIAADSYCVQKLFTKYTSNQFVDLEMMFLEISYFLEMCRAKEEIDEKSDFPQILYYFRNLVVHDIQFLFVEEEEKRKKIASELARIVLQIEYAILDTVKNITFIA